MARKSADDPTGWSGVRSVAWMAVPCGFCTTPTSGRSEEAGHECCREIAWFDKLWLCSCECNEDWKPVAVVIGRDGELGEVPAALVIAAAPERRRRGKKSQSSSEESVSDEENVVSKQAES